MSKPKSSITPESSVKPKSNNMKTIIVALTLCLVCSVLVSMLKLLS